MAKSIIDHLLLEQHLHFQEGIEKHLLQAEALVQFALNGRLEEQSISTIHDYLWIVGEVIEKARVSNQEALGLLLREF